jgi:peptidoglycan/xylan/chitin deacetylase (PgdA/CDA1 family)
LTEPPLPYPIRFGISTRLCYTESTMILKRSLVVVPAVLVLALLGFAIIPGSRGTAVVASIAGAIMPSATPTTTQTPTPTLTPTNTPTSTPTPTFTPSPTPLPTATPVRVRTVRVPILMYHYISVPPSDADKYRIDLSVTPASLDAQFDWLSNEGYHAILFSDLAEYLRTGVPALPPKPIVITFDDGYEDNYHNALPILKKYKFPATFFIITGFVDENRTGYMNWNQVEDLAIEGMEIGSHSMDHPDLRERTRAFLNTEIAGSKALIESRIGSPVKSFCYPSGKYDARVLDVLRTSGYLAAAATDPQGMRQSTDDIYEMQRIRIRGSYTVNELAYWIKYYSAPGK